MWINMMSLFYARYVRHPLRFCRRQPGPRSTKLRVIRRNALLFGGVSLPQIAPFFLGKHNERKAAWRWYGGVGGDWRQGKPRRREGPPAHTAGRWVSSAYSRTKITGCRSTFAGAAALTTAIGGYVPLELENCVSLTVVPELHCLRRDVTAHMFTTLHTVCDSDTRKKLWSWIITFTADDFFSTGEGDSDLTIYHLWFFEELPLLTSIPI
jgi:hypothetical protein